MGGIARAFLTSLLVEDMPKTIHEASKKGEWREAMKIEMEAIKRIKLERGVSYQQGRN